MTQTDNLLITFLTQLAGSSPTLLVYLVGMILALVFWRRSSTACLLCLIAMGLLLVTTVAQTFLNLYLIRGMANWGWSHQRLGWMLSATNIIGSIVRTLAMGLLLGAVFTGRKGASQVGFPQPRPRPESISLRRGEQGITDQLGE